MAFDPPLEVWGAPTVALCALLGPVGASAIQHGLPALPGLRPVRCSKPVLVHGLKYMEDESFVQTGQLRSSNSSFEHAELTERCPAFESGFI